MRHAAALAEREWGAGALYTTVAASNAGARALYADFGFVEVVVEGEEGKGGGGGGNGNGDASTFVVGRELLLRAEL